MPGGILLHLDCNEILGRIWPYPELCHFGRCAAACQGVNSDPAAAGVASVGVFDRKAHVVVARFFVRMQGVLCRVLCAIPEVPEPLGWLIIGEVIKKAAALAERVIYPEIRNGYIVNTQGIATAAIQGAEAVVGHAGDAAFMSMSNQGWSIYTVLALPLRLGYCTEQ